MGEPGIIRKLSEEVVNRIAAGEIVQRPANALKELIENSLDAKSTNIIITVKAGGLKYLQIQDNGSGIRKDDLEIVCERFTTSKLSKYEDLQEISTYGFRGEALASISHIAHLTILTKTAADKCAFKASYENGKLKGPIKACAGNNGTQITVEDLFYNVVARKKSLRSPNEEYTHIMDVVGGYAIHNSDVGFTLKKFGENTDLKTPIKSSVIENVRIIHGNIIARELMEIELQEPTLKLYLHGYITNVNYSHKKGTMLLFINHRLVDSLAIRKAVDSIYSTYLPKNSHAFVYLSIELDSSITSGARRFLFPFPWSQRDVIQPKAYLDKWTNQPKHIFQLEPVVPEINAFKQTLQLYNISIKKSKIFIDPKNVDVNVHPTKHEVQFLYEEQIIEKIKSCIESKLLSCNSTRVMYTQARLPGATNVEEIVKKTTESSAKVHASHLVRVTSDVQKIDKFFPTINKPIKKTTDERVINETENDETEKVETRTENVETEKMEIDEIQNLPQIVITTENNDPNVSIIEGPKENKTPYKWKTNTDSNITYIDPKESFKTRKFQYERVETKLTSVKQLRFDIEKNCNTNLREILANLIFIACIDCNSSLIQHSTKLYLCNTTRLAEELFYETMLYDFQNLGLIKLSNSLPLEELFVLGLSTQESEWDPELGDMREIARQMTELLISKRDMLLEYFSMEINEQGELLALPLLLDGHTPFMGALPIYLVKLVTEVNWQSEKECFDTFCRQTAIFYSQSNPDNTPEIEKNEHWKQEHVIFPAIRKFFLPPTSFVNNGAILHVASLNDLYKVFERC